MNEMEKIENLKSLLNREINYKMTEIKETMDFTRSYNNKLSKKSYPYKLIIDSIMHSQDLLNNVMKSLDVIMSRLFRLINCNFCYSSMATNFLQTSENSHELICDKCAEGVNNYKMRICGECDYPMVRQFNTENENLNHSKCGICGIFECGICGICSEYMKGIEQQCQTNFFNIDFSKITFGDYDSDYDSD